MPTILETQKKVVNNNIVDFAVLKLELNDDLNTMIAYMRNADCVNNLKRKIDRFSSVAGLDSTPPKAFDATFDEKKNTVCFSGDLQQAAHFLNAYEAISDKTKNETDALFSKKNQASECVIF